MSKGFKVIFDETREIDEASGVRASIVAKFEAGERVLMVQARYWNHGTGEDEFMSLPNETRLEVFSGPSCDMMRHIIALADEWYGLVRVSLDAHQAEQRYARGGR